MPHRDEIIDALTARFGYSGETVDYLVNISTTHNVLYFEVPKTGCTAVKLAMRHAEQPDIVVAPTKLHDRGTSPLARLSGLDHPVGQVLDNARYYKFAFVRDPYSRVLSAYLDKIVLNKWERARRLTELGFEADKEPTFHEFLERLLKAPASKLDIHWMPQSLMLGPDHTRFDDIFRFEAFQQAFDTVKAKLNIPRSDWHIGEAGKHHQTDASQRISEFYSAPERRLVNTLYSNDFSAFGYQKQE